MLGCILFLIYINDLPKIIDSCCSLYADDISVLIPCHNEVNLHETLDTALTDIITWLSDHNLQINFNKTKLMQFKPNQKRKLEIDYTYKNNKIECTDTFCLLGINIDSAVNWKEHVNTIRTKLSKFTYALYELKKVTDIKTAICAYYAYAHSILQYGIVLWGGASDTIQLFRAQKKCIRIIVNISQTDSCRPHFIKYKILTLTCIYILEVSAFVKKNLHLFTQQSRAQNLRPQNRLGMPTSKLKMVKCGPYSMAVKIYNHIPQEIKDEQHFNKFKYRLKQLLIKKAYYCLNEFLIEKNV